MAETLEGYRRAEFELLNTTQLGQLLQGLDAVRNISTGLLLAGIGAMAGGIANEGFEAFRIASPTAGLTEIGGGALLVGGGILFYKSSEFASEVVDELRKRYAQISFGRLTRRLRRPA